MLCGQSLVRGTASRMGGSCEHMLIIVIRMPGTESRLPEIA